MTMPGLTLDAAFSAQLRTIREPIELFDHQGCPLGTFTPLGKKEPIRGLEIPYTDEEIGRLKDQRGGRVLSEILADLEGRP
jgi:hypothetical protein